MLHSLTGLWIYGALLCRDLLSIPFKLFAFLERFQGQTIAWWPSVRKEVLSMAHAVSFMTVHLGCKLPKFAFATDACGSDDLFNGGYGICVSDISKSDLAHILEKGELPGKVMSRIGGLSGVKNPDAPLVPTVPFSLLDEEIFIADKWHAITYGEFQFPEHITLLEMRTVLKLLRLLSQCPDHYDSLIISLQDNMPTACSIAKGRSPVFALNRLLRMKASICLRSQFRTLIPWVQSAIMPADELSRIIKNHGEFL